MLFELKWWVWVLIGPPLFFFGTFILGVMGVALWTLFTKGPIALFWMLMDGDEYERRYEKP